MRKQTKREAAVMARASRELSRLVRFERAGFSLIEGAICNQADTDAIRKATARYMESWVIPLIDAITAGDLDAIERHL